MGLDLHIIDNDSFWTALGRFGPGMLTIDNNGMRSRPFLPSINRNAGEIACICERRWLGTSFALDVALNFIDEFSNAALSVRGIGRVSVSTDDIRAAWSGVYDRCYPDGRETPGLAVLKTAPRYVEAWRLDRPAPTATWIFENGVIRRQQP